MNMFSVCKNVRVVNTVLTVKVLSNNSGSTIDDQEVNHFKQYSSSWWNDKGDMKGLHAMNHIRIPFITNGLIDSNLTKREFVNTEFPLKEVKILDVGCGGGLLSEPLAKFGGDVTGIDASKDLIEIAKAHASLDKKLENLNFIFTSIEEFAVTNGNKDSFDCVIASEIIEHVNRQEIFLRECVHCLKPGGSIFITTMNKTILSQVFGICFAENILNILPIGTHQYEKFIEPHTVERILSNCRTKVTRGMFYNYFTNIGWSWIDNLSICYALHAQKL